MNDARSTHQIHRPRPSATAGSITEHLAGEMVARWQRGERPTADEYLDRHPELQDYPDAALELVAEELALRDEYGLPADPDEIAGRFPAWSAQVRALVRCQRAISPHAAPQFPDTGDVVGGFRLVAELGRGAYGRVFLATQPALADRSVVLKLSPDGGDEYRSLARLQHTHIVPLYSAHEFPERGLWGLCLPYFGGAALSAVLARVGAKGQPTTGADLVSALRRASPIAPGPETPPSPVWGMFGSSTYVDAVCRLGVCLADALHYAHDRELVHLDVKPSNVLIAADGVPMLLDFHLARPPLRKGDPAPAWLGGTPGYMAPEQVAASAAVQRQTGVPEDVDARADVYALGVVLSEALQAPVRNGGTVTVPAGVSDILARCLATDPGARYPTAAAVAVDLRRHLADLPLEGVRNRSLRERWRKWRRRRPLTLPLVLAAAAMLAATMGLATRTGRQADRAETIFREGMEHLRQGRYAEAAEAFHEGEVVLEEVPFRGMLRERFRAARRAATQGLAADELHATCERIRPFYAAELVTPAQVQVVRSRCLGLWDHREEFARSMHALGPERGQQVRADLLDLAVLLASIEVRNTPPDRLTEGHRRALTLLDQAEALLGPGRTLELERAAHARAAGLGDAAAAAERRATAHPCRTAWDHLVSGRAALAAGDWAGAAAAMDQALALDPRCFWASYYKGTCRLRTGDAIEALAAFSTCVALAPDCAWCDHNRGLAYLALDRPDAAVASFDRALTLDPNLGAALVGRAAAHSRSGQHAAALADLGRAAATGVPLAEVEYRRGVIHLAAGDRQAARVAILAALARDPGHRAAADLLNRLTPVP